MRKLVILCIILYCTAASQIGVVPNFLFSPSASKSKRELDTFEGLSVHIVDLIIGVFFGHHVCHAHRNSINFCFRSIYVYLSEVISCAPNPQYFDQS